MAENVMAMTLRMRNHAVTVSRNLRKDVDKTGRAATKMGTKFGKAVKATRTSLAGLGGSLVSVRTLIIATFAYRAIQKFTGFLRSLTEHTDVQVKATMELRQNMASFNQYTEEAAMKLEEVANVMQQQTGIADDLTMKNMALLLSYGAQADEIAKLTPLIIDFAKAKGIDEKTAFDLAGKASVGYFGTLSRYGVILDESLTKTEKYAEFVKLLTTFEGTAIAVTNNYAGSIAKLSANYGDMKEPMGDIIEKSIEQSGMLVMLNKHVVKAREFWLKWSPVMVEFGKKALGSVTRGLQGILDSVSSGAFLKWLIKVSSYGKIISSVFKITFRLMKAGYLNTIDLIAATIAKLIQLYQKLFGSKENYAAAKMVAEEAVNTMWNNIEKRANEGAAATIKDIMTIMTASKNIAKLNDPAFFAKWKSQMEERRMLLAKAAVADDTSSIAFVNNQNARQGAMEKVFKLSKSMAQQFALASRLEQEQTKFLLQKLKGEGVDVGQLTEMEKRLISKQGVLKETFGRVFGEFAQKQLGIEAPFLQETRVDLKIDLTDDAKKLIKIKDVDTEQNRNVERAMAG